MNKEELVNGLIANKATQYTEDDKAMLLELSEDILQKMAPVVEDPADTDDITPPDTPVGDVAIADAAEAEAAAALAASAAQPVTTDKYIADAPEELREVLSSGLKMHRARKDALVKGIMENSRNQFKQPALEAKSIDELESITVLAADISYAGNAPSLTDSAQNDQNAVPEPPQLFPSTKTADAA